MESYNGQEEKTWFRNAEDIEEPQHHEMERNFHDILHRCIGVHNAPIVYVIREYVAVTATVPVIMASQHHYIYTGSVEMELKNRASHIQPIFREDKKAIYHRL